MNRLLGIDYGEARIGIAVSDPLGITAQPLPFIPNNEDSVKKLKVLLAKYDVKEVVVGLPKRMNGELGISAEKAKEFGARLENELGVRTVFQDERLTTKLVERAYHEAGTSSREMRKNIDSSAASVILQSYMGKQKK